MFFWRLDKKPRGPVYDWLLANRKQVRDGTAEYGGLPVTDATEFCQYQYVISLLAVTFVFRTQHCLASDEERASRVRWKCDAATILFGWWCIPWGPLCSLRALLTNLRGGHRRTAASLLQLIEWGWDAPHDASAAGHRRQIVQLSESAAAVIRQRLADGKYPEGVAVRITPTKWADAEVEITFDFPVSDGRDWVDESRGLLLLIDREDEHRLSDCLIHFEEDRFYAHSDSGTGGPH